MNISAPFIARPVATTLIAVACVVAGIFAYLRLPIAPLPNVDFPTIQVQAQDPGASPSTVASTVAAPLERHLGAIADVTEITSQSTLGQTRITMQFGLDRNINGAARDVEAAIQAARADLPTSLRSNPSYFKFNPAGSPVMLLALTSKTKTTAQLYDSAQNVISQRLSQIKGIGYAEIGGSALPAVRVELTPQPLFQQGISLETVRAALSSANADTPKGVIDTPTTRYQLYTNDIANTADDYKPLIIGYIKGEPVKLANVAHIYDGTEDLRNAGLFDGQQAVIMILFPTPGANIVKTIDQVRAVLPYFRAELPADEVLTVAGDRSIAIRASLADTQRTLIIAVVLVTLVTLLFLRSVRATIIPAVVVPASIVATFAAMSLFGYSLDNLSLMALTVATGFVVDDAIVVLENIARYMEMGHGRLSAALLGAREVGFTVLSITVSLIAVFLPILLMQGIVGRLFREFAVTLATTIVISMFLSLTLTPMMCARFLSPPAHADENGRPNIVFRIAEATLRRDAAWLRAVARLVAPASAAADRELLRHHRSHGVAVRRGAEGLLPRPGHRPDPGPGAGRPVDLVPEHAAQDAGVPDHHPARPRDRGDRRLHRRPLHQQRLPVRAAQTVGGPFADRSGARTPASEARARARRAGLPARRRRRACRRPPDQRRLSVRAAVG